MKRVLYTGSRRAGELRFLCAGKPDCRQDAKVLVTSCVRVSADLPSLICGFQCGIMQTSWNRPQNA